MIAAFRVRGSDGTIHGLTADSGSTWCAIPCDAWPVVLGGDVECRLCLRSLQAVPSTPATDAARDAQALDRIAHMLRNPAWEVGMLDDIAELVGRTGRNVDGDGILSTWDRH